MQNLLPSLPLSLDALILLFLCLLAFELGRWIHRRFVARGKEAEKREESGAEAYIIGSIFGLFAFIVGFTFSIAVDRFDARRGWVAEEATAITTAFQRADMFDEPYRTRLQTTLRDYARSRIVPDGRWDESTDRQVERSHQLRRRLWTDTRAAAYPVRDTDQASYLIESTNEVLTVGTRRELAGKAHIPDRILNALLIYLVVSAGMLGYLAAEEPRRIRVTAGLLFVLMSFAIILILDIDQPRAGSIKVDQTALKQLVATLDRLALSPAASESAR